MGEHINNPEANEGLDNNYQVIAFNPWSKGNETIGTFEFADKGMVKFIPNTEKSSTTNLEILDKIFEGQISERIDRQGGRVYSLAFPKELDLMCPSMVFGYRRKNKDGIWSPREIRASTGQYEGASHQWFMSEEDWAKIDRWLHGQIKNNI